MKPRLRLPAGSLTLVCGAAMAAGFAGLLALPRLYGTALPAFLGYYLPAALAYLLAAFCLDRDRPPLKLIWGFAVLFRLLLLFQPLGLSTAVYRYAWDGRLLNLGVNPYQYPVDSPALAAYSTPLRSLVEHAWMASPYLPSAQVYFALVDRLAPGQPWAFQLAAALLDLATGWLVMKLLERVSQPPRRALLYLWNPLACIEFAVGGHLEAWMLFLTMAAFYALAAAERSAAAEPAGGRERHYALLSAALLAAATLTKGLPLLLAPLFLRRWRPGGVALYLGLVAAGCSAFAARAGWGLTGSLDGRGLFGALRIYMTQWNYNSSLYHWLETWMTGYRTAGGVPLEGPYLSAIRAARLLTSAATAAAAGLAGLWAWRLTDCTDRPEQATLGLLRLANLPVGAYLLLTHTVHPWYVTFILPFTPFLLPAPNERTAPAGFAWPWLYLACAVPLSYLTYFDPTQPREFAFVRPLEYLPAFLLLATAAGLAALSAARRRQSQTGGRNGVTG